MTVHHDENMTNELLTQIQVDSLCDGTEITVIWDGGNGPANYTYREGFAWISEEITNGELYESGMKGRCLDHVGKERYHQKVWLL